MTAIMAFQQDATTHSGWIAAAGRRLILAWPAIVTIVIGATAWIIAAWPMFFRLPRTWRFVLKHRGAILNTMFATGNAITGGKLNFQLNNFIPLFVGSIALRYRKEITQTAAIIVGWRGHNGQDFRRGFGIRISHRKLKSGARYSEPRIE
ncbi:MAG TPA: hypothetical protein VLA64_06530 [Azonexus sp.]|nr:hypothetical protein [Azonexus sp.]